MMDDPNKKQPKKRRNSLKSEDGSETTPNKLKKFAKNFAKKSSGKKKTQPRSNGKFQKKDLKQLTLKRFTKKENKEEDVFDTFFEVVLNGNTTKSWTIAELYDLKKELNENLKQLENDIVQKNEKTINLEKTNFERASKKRKREITPPITTEIQSIDTKLNKINENMIEEMEEEEEDEEDEEEEEEEDFEEFENVPNKRRNQNEFWNYIETYFVPITSIEKLNYLQPKAIDLNFEIPPLGKHYSEDWMDEDSEMYHENENKKKIKNKKINSMGEIKSDELNLEIASESLESNNLIQRLLSTLIDENNIKGSSSSRKRTKLKKIDDDFLNEDVDNDDISISTNDYTPKALKYFGDKMWNELKGLGISSSPSLMNEQRNQHQILSSENDEISKEIKLLQDRLKEQHSRNEEKKLKVLKITKDSIQIERKIQKKFQEYKQIDKEYKQLTKKKKL
eukprot:gene3447-6096_t